jgi:excisionase family DNA binding protein
MNKFIITTAEELEYLIHRALKKFLKNQKGNDSSAVEDKLMTLQEASKFLNLAPQTIYGLCSKRNIPFVKKGKLYFSKKELTAWLLEGSKKSISQIKADLEGGNNG